MRPAGLYYNGDPGFPEKRNQSAMVAIRSADGLAWDVTGNGRTSIRASYSLGYIALPSDFRERYPVQVRGAAESPCRARLEDCPHSVPQEYPAETSSLRVEQGVQFVPYGWVLTQSYDLPLHIHSHGT